MPYVRHGSNRVTTKDKHNDILSYSVPLALLGDDDDDDNDRVQRFANDYVSTKGLAKTTDSETKRSDAEPTTTDAEDPQL